MKSSDEMLMSDDVSCSSSAYSCEPAVDEWSDRTC